ncbi:MAG: ATP-binding cassette domain-containing protein [Bifidobacterium sp.]|uniref:ATP-binding cassette domain-containing protein n=1 Tax=Bifidobacterium choladohabitans TaxID=2750947 RepID=A0ABS0QYH7_9BIFI|nr:ATP-binding cassette domain-containing protein [Bifidobacterium choladohabitans]MBI0143455.1 ATP-binding cassette domain-containing protein [Bifidobacterium choladohabitans]MCT6901390.1 ATP-binding cassette domain-containing protein [Bifidobacterium sp.]
MGTTDVAHADPILIGKGLTKIYASNGSDVAQKAAVDGIDVSLMPGECLAIIGESGSGKTTLSRLLLGQLRPDAGQVAYQGSPVLRGSAAARSLARDSALVFQNPFASLDPRWTIGRSVAEPLLAAGRRGSGHLWHRRQDGTDLADRVAKVLSEVQLDPDRFMTAYPSDLSGGQAQRAAIARALVVKPRILLADEPMSAIDVSARVGILHTLQSIMAQSRQQADPSNGMSMIIISHDLGVVQHIADRVMVLSQGRVVEEGPVQTILDHPSQSYTRQLLAAATL